MGHAKTKKSFDKAGIDDAFKDIEKRRYTIEFIKRNPKFLSDQKKLAPLLIKQIPKSYPKGFRMKIKDRKELFRKFLANLPPLQLMLKNRLKLFLHKWKINPLHGWPLNDKPFNKNFRIMAALGHYCGDIPIKDKYRGAIKTIKEPIIWNENRKWNDPYAYIDKKAPNTLIISVDLSYSNERIFREFEKEVKMVKTLVRKDAGYSYDKEKDYDVILRIFDLRKAGKSWTQIARIIYPKNVDIENAKRKCRAHYSTCLNLIKNGL